MSGSGQGLSDKWKASAGDDPVISLAGSDGRHEIRGTRAWGWLLVGLLAVTGLFHLSTWIEVSLVGPTFASGGRSEAGYDSLQGVISASLILIAMGLTVRWLVCRARPVPQLLAGAALMLLAVASLMHGAHQALRPPAAVSAGARETAMCHTELALGFYLSYAGSLLALLGYVVLALGSRMKAVNKYQRWPIAVAVVLLAVVVVLGVLAYRVQAKTAFRADTIPVSSTWLVRRLEEYKDNRRLTEFYWLARQDQTYRHTVVAMLTGAGVVCAASCLFAAAVFFSGRMAKRARFA